MSGTDLAGFTSSARADAEVQGTPRANGRPHPSSVALKHDLPGTRGQDGSAGYAGLPSAVIHELRTPLTSIHGYAQVLQRSLRDNERATKALSIVVRESTRLSAMLASLSELAELQSGGAVVTPIEIDAHRLVDGVVDEVTRRDGNAHPIQVAGSGRARCNPTLLSQALLHVLTNATLFSPTNTPVEVMIRPRSDLLTIEVADRGMGIAPEDADRIYGPFERGANARQAGIRGLGLGLFLASESLSLLHGRLSHRARGDGGTIFRLVVPGA